MFKPEEGIEEETITPLLEKSIWRDFELVGGINIYQENGPLETTYYNLETVITLPAEKIKRRKKKLQVERGLENFKLIVRKTFTKNNLISHDIMIRNLDGDQWSIAKFPYKHFSPDFFEKFEKISKNDYKFRENASPREVYNLVYNVFDYYLDIEQEKLTLFTIYTLGTYFYKLFPTFPYLYLFGATESGKTKTLSIFEKLCFNGIATINLSPSALFRLVEVFGATLCIDESEYLKDSERRSELQSLLFSGYKKESGNVLRVEGDKTKNVRVFHVYSPKVMASINYPNDVLLTRCIIINMKRGTNREKLNRIPMSDFLDIKNQIYLMLFNYFDELLQIADMDFNNEYLVGREHELWRPLFVIGYWLKLHIPEKTLEIDNALNILLEQDVLTKQSLRIDSDLITILYTLNNIKEDGVVMVQTIRDLLLDEYRDSDIDYRNMSRYWTPEKIGRQISSLGFKKTRRQGRTYYYIDTAKVKQLCNAYNITTEDVPPLREASTSSTSSTCVKNTSLYHHL